MSDQEGKGGDDRAHEGKSATVTPISEAMRQAAEKEKPRLARHFPGTRALDEGFILAAQSTPCHRNKDHDHTFIILNSKFNTGVYYPEESNEDIEIFDTLRELQAYAAKLDPETAANIPASGQMTNGKFFIMKNPATSDRLTDKINGTPRTVATIQHSDNVEKAFQWIDRIAVCFAARDGVDGARLGMTEAGEGPVLRISEGTENGYSHWRPLIENAINTQIFAKILAQNELMKPLTAHEAVSAIDAILNVGGGLGMPKYRVTSDGNKYETKFLIPALEMTVELSTDVWDDGQTHISLSYKDENGETRELSPQPLTTGLFMNEVFAPMEAALNGELLGEISRVDHLLAVARDSAPDDDLPPGKMIERLLGNSKVQFPPGMHQKM